MVINILDVFCGDICISLRCQSLVGIFLCCMPRTGDHISPSLGTLCVFVEEGVERKMGWGWIIPFCKSGH